MKPEDQWAEDHGIHVGYCNRHKVKIWDETCDRCMEEEHDIPEHDCVFISGCCGAYPADELDDYLTGHCGKCHDGAGFECEEFEDCPNNSETRLEEANARRRL